MKIMINELVTKKPKEMK